MVERLKRGGDIYAAALRHRDCAVRHSGKLLKARPALRVYVVGHTDSVGTLDYNLTLSENRARSVTQALVRDYGIATDRLVAKGVGPLVPVFANSSDGGKQKNRRVELVQR
jgi:OmpA-OmpF porin, OOP family